MHHAVRFRAASCSTTLALLLSAVHGAATSPVNIVKLGAFDYSTQETTPVVFNGRLILVEAVSWPSWQHAGRWLPAFNSTLTCNDYFRVRDVAANHILVNMTSSCNFAFPSAFVTRGAESQYETLTVFAQPWNRGGHVQTTCSRGANCTVHAWTSTDPLLLEWKVVGPAAEPGFGVYNADIAHVGARIPNLPGVAQWVLILEGLEERSHFAVSSAEDAASGDLSQWTFLDSSYLLPQLGGDSEIGSCPSIRYDIETGYFYVLTGGMAIILLRSKDLKTWELASQGTGGDGKHGWIIYPDQRDCVPCSASGLACYTPNAEARQHMETNCPSPFGFGDDSDVDLTEVVINGTRGTLFEYGSGDQATFGFSNYAWSPKPMFETLSSFFRPADPDSLSYTPR
jgi:hypothetical protein